MTEVTPRAAALPAEVSGFLEIRSPDGTLKARLPFVGTTHLTEDELRARLNLTPAE